MFLYDGHSDALVYRHYPDYGGFRDDVAAWLSQFSTRKHFQKALLCRAVSCYQKVEDELGAPVPALAQRSPPQVVPPRHTYFYRSW